MARKPEVEAPDKEPAESATTEPEPAAKPAVPTKEEPEPAAKPSEYHYVCIARCTLGGRYLFPGDEYIATDALNHPCFVLKD
jgi:hypothetical protein